MTTRDATLAGPAPGAHERLGVWPFPPGPTARIAYGAARVPTPGAALAHGPDLLVERGRILRLNDEGFALPAPSPGEPARTAQERLADHLRRLSGGWNGQAARFIEGYLAYLRAVVAANRPRIAERLRPLAGLFTPEDVLYSAPLPLPRAWLPLAEDGGALPCPVDMLLWHGEAAQAVLFVPSALTPGAERRRRERLAAAGIGLYLFGAAELARPSAFADLLGETGGGFWRDEPLPIAPGAPPLPAF
ncbi:hypothetical protein [Ancylobacter sp. IITR112]|uniref:hypothetical protein n=1 Tax=Ancylobacter sp. IITR112 TaxID=3138073 RepID=UPI00352A1F3C